MREPEPTLRVSALHAFAYCPRLFYLEEVEELYTQDAAMFAGRRLHVDLEKQEDEEWEDSRMVLEPFRYEHEGSYSIAFVASIKLFKQFSQDLYRNQSIDAVNRTAVAQSVNKHDYLFEY